MSENTMQKNTAFRRVKYLTLMQIGDGVRDLRTGSKARLAARIALKTLLAVVLMAVFVLVFGEIQTREFLEYYENRYSEAFLDVINFITDEIMPAINEAVNEENTRISALMK